MKTSKYGFPVGATTVVTSTVVTVALALFALVGQAQAGPQVSSSYGDQFT